MADAKEEVTGAVSEKAKSAMEALPTFSIKGELAKLNEEDIQKEVIPVHCKLAASYGLLNKHTLQKMDDKLKVIITATTKAISKLDDYAWENVVSCMMNNPLLEPIEGAHINRSDKLIKEGFNVFDFDSSPDHVIVKEVHSWFVGLIKDEDILNDTHIDVDVMAKIVGQTGARINHIFALVAKRDYEERDIVDVGILRYPDIEFPYFKLYRIRLIAWSECKRLLMVQKDCNGITGYFNCMKFKPRNEVIASLKEEVFNKAVADAEALLA